MKRALAVALALTALTALLAFFASRREGAWDQTPLTDSAVFHGDAIRILRATQKGGIGGFAHAWVETNRTHTPLVAALSAGAMALFGESRHVAESVLLLFVFVFLLSTLLAVERLYDAKTAVATAALFASFPVFLNLSRLYVYELPFAALVVAACAALLASDFFAHWPKTLLFGLLAGGAALARAGGSVLVVAPTLVALAVALRRPQPGLRLLRLAAATALALAVAATWYVPNLEPLRAYLRDVTYGDQAELFAGGASFTRENAEHYLGAILLQGIGVPIAATALTAAAITAVSTRGASLRSPTMAALGAVFLLDFLILMLAAQRCGAILFLAALPILAVAAVRAVFGLRPPALRGGAAALVALFALHQAWGASLGFPIRPAPGEGTGPIPLWWHRSFFIDWAGSFTGDPRADFKIPEILARLESVGLAEGARIAVLTDHPFVHAYGLDLESLARRHRRSFLQAPSLWTASRDDLGPWKGRVRELVDASDAVVIRATPWREPPSRLFAEAFAPSLELFEPAGEPIRLGDDSSVTILRRRAR